MAPADPRYPPSSDGASAARASHGTHPSATAAEAPGTVSQRGRSGGAGGPADITRSLGRLPTRLESLQRGDPEPRVGHVKIDHIHDYCARRAATCSPSHAPRIARRWFPGGRVLGHAAMAGPVQRIVLAYSGGLDTSVILRWLVERYRAEVVAFSADLGQAEELAGLEEKARRTGATKTIVEDLREEFVRDFVLLLFRAGAIYVNL